MNPGNHSVLSNVNRLRYCPFSPVWRLIRQYQYWRKLFWIIDKNMDTTEGPPLTSDQLRAHERNGEHSVRKFYKIILHQRRIPRESQESNFKLLDSLQQRTYIKMLSSRDLYWRFQEVRYFLRIMTACISFGFYI